MDDLHAKLAALMALKDQMHGAMAGKLQAKKGGITIHIAPHGAEEEADEADDSDDDSTGDSPDEFDGGKSGDDDLAKLKALKRG
jgi:hypothetical protein